jgi:cell division protein ZapA
MAPNGPVPRVITVEIQGQRYPIRSHLDASYIAELAAFVEARIRAAATESPSADSVRVVVLAALNIADELFRAREATESAGGVVSGRIEALERLVDRAIQLADTPDPPPLAAPPASV